MQESLSRLRDAWQNTTRANQIMLVTAVVAAMLVGIGFLYWAGSPEYATLVSNPSPSDSARILDLLKSKKVAYRISADGNTIEVPAANRAELRMEMAGNGMLNSGSLGYELLDKMPFGQTQAVEEVRIRESMEQEIEKSITSLDPVASANVKLAPGDQNTFVNPERKEPSASVLVHLKPGSELSKSNVRAIVSLVKSAYTGLTEKNISLVDGEGNLLWDGAQQSADTVGADERQTQERQYKEALAREIQGQIQAAVGPNKSSVMVRTVLNLDKQSQVTHDVTPGVRTSRTVDEETLKGGGSIAPGQRPPAGTAANVGGTTPPTYSGGVDTNSGNYAHTVSNETMANGTSETSTVKAPGEVKFLAVSVLLDDTVPAATATALQQSIQTYVGVDPSRQVTVQRVPFDRSAALAEKTQAQAEQNREMIYRSLSYGVPLVIMAIMLMVLSKALKPKPTPAQLALAAAGAAGAPALAAAAGGTGAAEVDMLVGEGAQGLTVEQMLDGSGDSKVVPVADGDDVHTFQLISEAFDANLESITHLAKSKPEMVALLIKSWVSDRK